MKVRPNIVTATILPVHKSATEYDSLHEVSNSNVWLVQRAQEPCKNSWTIPGGFVEMGETWEEAAARELKEELGLNVQPYELDFFTMKTSKITGHLILFSILARPVKQFEFQKINHDEIVKVTSFNLFNPIDSKMMPFTTHREALQEYKQVYIKDVY
jgi:ADP-ribose pyrophosphatase YjhB (NUDIX family)